MTHAATLLQRRLVAAFAADSTLEALLGPDRVFDAPPKGIKPPYVSIVRHDIRPIGGDEATLNEHRLTLQARVPDAARAAALDIADRLEAIALGGGLSGEGLTIATARHERTETLIDLKTGEAVATLVLRIVTEPTL